jgi:predicted DNA-binding transcriptional regulator AlpA
MEEGAMDELISPAEARRISGGLSESTIRRLVSDGAYPKPITLSRNRRGGPARIAFVRAEVLEWNRQRIAADRQPAA